MRETPPAAAGETAHPAPSVAPPATPPLAPKGYVVQLGVFSDYRNAIDLQKRLAQHGIKSYTETRLNLGPFHSKAEAEQSMIKLRRLGISAVVAPNR
ncbi:MAG TPA: SPOR domain-containing protein [Betaproteobacteria bacterium]|nr:SPOR domain-containing protein [Betaproteobacteria bacterium]